MGCRAHPERSGGIVTIKELIKVLKTFNLDADIVCEWDGGYSNPDDIRIDGDGIVVIDVSEYGNY